MLNINFKSTPQMSKTASQMIEELRPIHLLQDLMNRLVAAQLIEHD